MDVTETIAAAGWDGPFDAATRARAVAALEAGRVLLLDLPFAVLPEETGFLDAGVGDASRKNVSLDPRTGVLAGTALSGEARDRLTAMVARYGVAARALTGALLPYGDRLEPARTSFRPAEIAGRPTTPRHDDRLLHVDAFPTRPLRGRRILRVFANIAPDGTPRRWRVGEPFPDFARRYADRLRPPLPGHAAVLKALGLTKGTRSAYDHHMLRLHDLGKLDRDFQATAPRAELELPPGTAWMCFTDSVLHAALSGRCALEQTFHLPVTAMAEPARAPLRVLESLLGRALM